MLLQKMKHIKKVFQQFYNSGSLINPVLKEYKLTYAEIWSVGKEVDILST